MKRNPFDKFIKGETAIHIQVAEYLQYQYPNVMFHHSPNEARRTPFERYLISKMGVSAGFPDFVIYGKNFNLYLELKYKDNTPADVQLNWLKHLNSYHNAITAVAWSFESAKHIIDFYIGPATGDLPQLNFYKMEYVIHIQDILPAKIKKLLN